MLVVNHAHCDYLVPARYDDLLEIHTRVSELTRAKIHFQYEVHRGEDGELLARGETRHAYLSPEGKLRRMSREWFEQLGGMREAEGAVR